MSADLMRTPTHDHEAERATLGAMLAGAPVVDDVADIITGADYYRPTHEAIHHAILRVHGRGDRPDPVLVARELGGDLQRVGGAPYLLELISPATAPNPLSATLYAQQVSDRALQRRLSEAGQQVQQMAEQTTNPAEAAEDARHVIDQAAATASTSRSDSGMLGDLLPDALDQLDHPVAGISTPWPDLDGYTSGLHPGQLIVIGARPAVGKSVVGTNLAQHVAGRLGIGTHLASLEMSRNEVVNRLLSSHARINLSNLMAHRLSESDWDLVARHNAELSEWPLVVDDKAPQTLQQIRAGVRNSMRRTEVGLVVVDYLQLMAPRDRRSPRQEQVAELSTGLKMMAKELGVPVVAMAQVNRRSTQSSDGWPTMADLRESGQIEADADQVWLLHRDDDDRPGEIGIRLAKVRNGPTGTVWAGFQGHYSTVAPYPR